MLWWEAGTDLGVVVMMPELSGCFALLFLRRVPVSEA